MVEVAQSAEPAVELERILGASSALLSANWAARAARAADTVCSLKIQQDSEHTVIGTGFPVSPLLLTACHVLPDAAAARTAVAEFTVDSDGRGGDAPAAPVLPEPERVLRGGRAARLHPRPPPDGIGRAEPGRHLRPETVAMLTGITNATAESLNWLAKLEGRLAYGFRSPVNQRRRVRIACARG